MGNRNEERQMGNRKWKMGNAKWEGKWEMRNDKLEI